MNIQTYPFGPLQANLYILFLKNYAFIIDPCVNMESLDLKKFKVAGIFMTHAHYDHIIEADNIADITGAPLFALDKEQAYFKDPIKNGSLLFTNSKTSIQNHMLLLKDGDVLSTADFGINDEHFVLRIIHTPGHSSGSMCLLFDFPDEKGPQKHLFTGDTLFAGTIGRTDIGGNMDDMRRSIAKISMLQDQVIIYPGHGESSTIGREKQCNPYFTPTFYNDII